MRHDGKSTLYWENMNAQSQRSKGGFAGCTLVAGNDTGYQNTLFIPLFTVFFAL